MTASIMLSGSVANAPPYLVGFDTTTAVSADYAASMVQQGYRFCVRYVSLGAESGGDLTTAEASTILAAGLALMPVQHVNYEGWAPTESLGQQHGASAASNAAAVGFPPGTTVWMDLEGVSQSSSSSDVIAYSNAWYDAVASAGFAPGIYVGALCNLTSEQLYQSLEYEHYWKSLSAVPDVETRGYQMVQTAGTSAYDNNRTQNDNLGGQVAWLAQGIIDYPVLKQGMKGFAVGSLQMALNAAGASPQLAIDDDFGAGTFSAVEAFQRKQGLSVDGIAGHDTWTALAAVTSAPASGTTTTGGTTGTTTNPSSAPWRMPMSGELYALFSKLFGLLPAQADEDLAAELARAVGAYPSTRAGAVTPGDLASITAALSALSPQAATDAALSSRLSALTSFYTAQAALPADQQASPLRLAVVSIAMTQIGEVSAEESGQDPWDPPGSRARDGWVRLDEFFETSFQNTSYGVDTVRYPPASGQDDALPAWCGIFALWANKSAGLSLGTWKIGCGISAVDGMTTLPAGSKILPGDVGVLYSQQHHFVVVSVDDQGNVSSVDGNHTVDGVGGRIGPGQHAPSEIAGFYRASGLV